MFTRSLRNVICSNVDVRFCFEITLAVFDKNENRTVYSKNGTRRRNGPPNRQKVRKNIAGRDERARIDGYVSYGVRISRFKTNLH